MPKQIIVRVREIRDEKSRKKAMTTAAAIKGVDSVSVEGERRDQVVVAGDGVKPAELEKKLKGALGFATLDVMQNVERPNDQLNKIAAAIYAVKGIFGSRRTQR